MKLFSQYLGLPRPIYVLFIARTINSLGYFIFPFLTLFLSIRIGFSQSMIGIFLFVASVVYIPGSIIGGKLADHYNRKMTYIVATICSNLIYFICGFLGDSILIPYLLIPAFFFTSIAFTGSSAMLMDLTNPKNRQESFSILYLGMNIGIAIGPLVAGFLFAEYTSWIFWGDAISGFIAAFLVSVYIKDTTPSDADYKKIIEEGRHEEAPHAGSIIEIILSKPILLMFVIFCAVLSFSYSQTGFILPLQLNNYFGSAEGAKYFGLLMSANGFVVVLFTPIIVAITKKVNPIINLTIASLCYSIGFGMYAFTKSLYSFIIFVIIWTIGEILSATNTGVYIANRTPISHRARLQAIYDIIQGTGRAIGPMVVGYSLIVVSIEQAWIGIGLLCFIAAVSFFILRIYENKRIQKLTK